MTDLKSLAVSSIPLTVPVSENETEAQFLDRWKKVDALTFEKKEMLSSEITIGKIEDIAKRFRLTYEEACDISRLVRFIIFGEISVSQIDLYLKQKIQHIEQVDRDNVKNIVVEILSQKTIKDEAEIENKESVTLDISNALSQYPKIGEQNITGDQIKLRYFPTLVRPSIKNWITAFHDEMGAGKHSPIDRGNFLFHSENGKKLSALDRQKLGTVLKSLDEQTLLNVDTVAQIVVFEKVDGMQNLSSASIENKEEKTEQPRNAFGTRMKMDNMELPKKETLSDINLKNEQRPPSFNTHDVFGDLSSVAKTETAQEQQLQPRTQGFFAKPESRNILKATPVSTSKLAVFPAAQEGVAGDDYFSIPQSKPPIGSESYHTESLQDINKNNIEEIENFNNTQTSLPSGHLSSSEERKIMKESLNEQDRDSMSDDLLYKMLQEKKIKQEGVGQLVASDAGVVSFSSPQKLPAEQGTKPNQIQTPQPGRSSFHIGPSDYANDKKDGLPRVIGNVVNLKE